MRLGDERMAQRLLVGGGGTDEEVLGAAAGKEANVTLHVSGLVCDEVGDDIEGAGAEGGNDRGIIMDVADQRSRPVDAMGGKVAVAAIENENLVSLGEGEPNTRGADVAGSTDEEEFHGFSIPVAQSIPFQSQIVIFAAQFDRRRHVSPAAGPWATRPAQFDPGSAADPSLARP